jgi:hypothetical protein
VSSPPDVSWKGWPPPAGMNQMLRLVDVEAVKRIQLLSEE